MAQSMPSAQVDAQDPQRRQQLEIFVGRWKAVGESFSEGQRAEDPLASAVPWISEESYEWLPGGYFLVHRWDAMVGSYPFKGIEIIGFDERRGCFTADLFDNAGHHGAYRGRREADVWRFEEQGTRSTITVSPGGQEMDVNWEWRNGGRDWRPLCHRRAYIV